MLAVAECAIRCLRSGAITSGGALVHAGFTPHVGHLVNHPVYQVRYGSSIQHFQSYQESFSSTCIGTDIAFGYMEYAHARFEEYLREKQALLEQQEQLTAISAGGAAVTGSGAAPHLATAGSSPASTVGHTPAVSVGPKPVWLPASISGFLRQRQLSMGPHVGWARTRPPRALLHCLPALRPCAVAPPLAFMHRTGLDHIVSFHGPL